MIRNDALHKCIGFKNIFIIHFYDSYSNFFLYRNTENYPMNYLQHTILKFLTIFSYTLCFIYIPLILKMNQFVIKKKKIHIFILITVIHIRYNL